MADALTIDKEFAALCGQQTQEELALLEQMLLADGCRDPIILWANHDDTILDGHTRYGLCQKLGIPFKTKALKFDTREAARNWIIDNQLARRNLSEERKAYLRGKRYQAEKKNDHDGGKGKSRSGGKDCHHLGKTSAKIATQLGVSEKTVRNDAAFAGAVDTLAKNVGTKLKDEILSGASGLSKKEVVAIAAMPAKQQREAIDGDVRPASSSRRFDRASAIDSFRTYVKRTFVKWPKDKRRVLIAQLRQLANELDDPNLLNAETLE